MPSLLDLKNAVTKAKNILEGNNSEINKGLMGEEQPAANLSTEQRLEFYKIKGQSALEVGWYKMSVQNFLEHLKIAKQFNKKEAIIESYISLGQAEFYLGNHIESLKYYIQALNLSLKEDNLLSYWVAHGFLGISHIYAHFKKYDYSLIIQRQSLIFAKLTENKELIAKILLAMVPTLFNLKSYSLALKISEQVIEILESENIHEEWLAEAFNYRGSICLKQECYEEAIKNTNKAYVLSDKMNAPWPICLNLSLLGQIFLEKKDYIKATEYLQKAMYMAHKMNFTELEKEIKNELMLVYDKTFMHKEVLEMIKDSNASLDINHKDLNLYLKEQIDNQTKNIDLMLDMLEVVKQNEHNQNKVILLEKETYLDALTGIHNRRALDNKLQTILITQQKAALLMMDIDFFKKINDSYGHIVGDKVLKEIGQILTKICRKDDFVARYGGEEISVIISSEYEEIAVKTAQRIRETIEKYDWSKIHPLLKVTISIGVSMNKGNYEKIEEWVNSADGLLYRAKHSGRNKVCYENEGIENGDY